MSDCLPKVTVLMPTYNRPAYLKEAIASVVNQSLRQWELLVMNDGGVDVASIVASFRDDRIRYIPGPVNRGKAHRLNLGLLLARGAYIAYLDDDDRLYPNHLDVLSEALDHHPEVDVVYSDLYAVQFVRDQETGKRYPVHKYIQVSRDYNRDFMFYFNHTLHVSLMHRKEIALRAGGYDERIPVLIDWNLTRKLSFFTDFKYVPVVTGEYFMPLGLSDRISNLQRTDPEKFRHNIRKIRADLPPEPWTKVDTVAVIFPVFRWTEAAVKKLTDLVDAICYPVQYRVVNAEPGVGKKAALKALGPIGELANLRVLTARRPLNPLAAYRFAARRTQARYVYLPTEHADPSVRFRIVTARHFMEKTGCTALKWNVAPELNTSFDMLIDRERFLAESDEKTGAMQVEATVLPKGLPPSLETDVLLHMASERLGQGDPETAYRLLGIAGQIRQGGAGEQYLIELFADVCFASKRYGEAEKRLSQLIRRGYGADNWIRLGKILQEKGRYAAAAAAYRKGLKGIEISEADLDSRVFPIAASQDFGSFAAFMGIGQCRMHQGRLSEAARMFRRAARLKANGHGPFLGFAKLFLASGDERQAEVALQEACRRCAGDPEPDLLLARLYETGNRTAEALEQWHKVLDQDPGNRVAQEALERMTGWTRGVDWRPSVDRGGRFAGVMP